MSNPNHVLDTKTYKGLKRILLQSFDNLAIVTVLFHNLHIIFVLYTLYMYYIIFVYYILHVHLTISHSIRLKWQCHTYCFNHTETSFEEDMEVD